MGLILLLVMLLLLPGCAGDSQQGEPSLQELLRQEEELLARQSETLSAVQAFGTDPYRIDYLPGLDRYLVLLRNASQVLLCTPDLRVLDRRPAPRSPTAWDRQGEERLFLGGELSSSLSVYRIRSDRLLPLESIPLRYSVSVRDLTYLQHPRPALFLLDGFDRQLVRLDLEQGSQQFFPLGAGPASILSLGGHLVINLLYQHAILIVPLSAGIPDMPSATRLAIQGPFWSVDAVLRDDRLLVAAGGVEDRPLDRSQGEFGNLDSFLYLFELTRSEGVFRPSGEDGRVAYLNLSELGVVTPKALSFHRDAEGLELWVAGSGSGRVTAFQVDGFDLRLMQSFEAGPGASELTLHMRQSRKRLALANPLLDRIDLFDAGLGVPSRVGRPLDLLGPRIASDSSRLGEILFFSTLMSPGNRSEGSLSRLTCEACHFEGGLDGRVHFTGRDDIHLATKPLRGLADNVPLFSRGGDATLSSMVMAEFRVINQGRKDIFELRPSHFPWMRDPDAGAEVLTPAQLRKAFLSFFVDFRHRPNPWSVRQKELDPLARVGLEVFRRRCEDCHQAIDATRQGQGIPPQEWPGWLLSEDRDPIWGAPFYSKTGIRPYVDQAGTRVPSLRRVWLKYPYFTDGSSTTIGNVLGRFRYRGSTVWHHYNAELEPGPAPEALTPEEVEALEALLRYF
ncbi:MAG TPA: hypothetical protein VLU25_10590 [Acidobacteriota bacterium]|nr:hypothetical protein [Acidobacteriota bacterium]